MKSTKKIVSSFSGSTEKAVEASFLVSLRIAKCKKPHTIGEELILPTAKDMVTCMSGESSAKQLDIISLSNDTVRRRVENIILNVKEKLIVEVKNSVFFLYNLMNVQMYQTMLNLLFIYGIYYKLRGFFLVYETLTIRTTADDIFKKLDHFFVENGFNWKKCIGFYSDGARAMTSKHEGVSSKIKLVIENCIFLHCSFHRKVLVVKRMPE